jgi:hypothetical protein
MMRLAGRVFRAGRAWAIEVPILDVVTQGETKRDSFLMIADAIESLVDREGFGITVHPGQGDYFEIGATDEGALVAFLLRRARLRSGLTLAEAARRLHAKSHNAYARYEQGRAVPSVGKLSELLSAVSPSGGFVIGESHA